MSMMAAAADALARSVTASAIVVGLDNAGKSTMLASLPALRGACDRAASEHGVDDLEIAPTCGVQLCRFTMARASRSRFERRTNVKWRVWDFSGRGPHRTLWPMCGEVARAVVWVVDALDTARVGVLRDEFRELMSHFADRKGKLAVLVLLNKADGGRPEDGDAAAAESAGDPDAGVLTQDHVKVLLGVDALAKRHQVRILNIDALSGQGVEAAWKYLSGEL